MSISFLIQINALLPRHACQHDNHLRVDGRIKQFNKLLNGIRHEKYAVNSQHNYLHIYHCCNARNETCMQGVNAGTAMMDAGFKPDIYNFTYHTTYSNSGRMQLARILLVEHL